MDFKWKKIATNAVTNDDYKKKLWKDPLGVMKEAGLEPPAEARVNKNIDNEIKLLLPDNAGDELKAIIAWWDWRLKTINEFGREVEIGAQEVMPETEEGI